jgi:hypothetical protein
MDELKEAPQPAQARWQQLVAEFEASGMTRKAFSVSRSISVNTLDAWRKRGKPRPQRASKPAPTPTPFVELPPLPGASALDVELELGGGVVLRLRRNA